MTESNTAALVPVHDRLVRFDELKSDWGIRFSRVHLARLEKAGRFPGRLTFGHSTVGWLASELSQYLANCAATRSGGAA